MQQTRQLKKLLITSTLPEEGKSLVSANLAATLARRKQQKVLLLEGDLRRPVQAQLFGGGRARRGSASGCSRDSPRGQQYLLSGRPGILADAGRHILRKTRWS